MSTVFSTALLPVHTAENISDKSIKLVTDVVIVGSGAGGAVMAYELAKAGRKVVLLEAGPYIPSSEFSENHPDMMAKLYQDKGAQRNVDGDLLVLQGRCLGGSTVVNATACFRTPDIVLAEWRELHGLSDLTPERLEPFFAKVEKNLSVHVNQPHEINTNCRIIERGCEKLGVSYKAIARNVKDCALSGFCLAGCASDRKQSMLVTYIPWAIHYGAQVWADAHVEKIISKNGRAAGVQAVINNRQTGRKVADLQVAAKLVVVAAGAIQSPLLLLRSGLGNSSGQVGQNFACHPSVGILADYNEDIYGWKGATLGSYCDEWETREKGGFIFEFAMAGADFMSAFSPGIGSEHWQFMSRLKNTAGMIALFHDENVGRVGLSKNGQKEIHYRVSLKDQQTIRQCLIKASELHFAAGANHVYLPTYRPIRIDDPKDIARRVAEVDLSPRGLALTTYHPQGTCRMGADPKRSVVNAHGECHNIPGLFVADASLFPTSIMVNPQITVYTLSSYIADYINQHASDYF